MSDTGPANRVLQPFVVALTDLAKRAARVTDALRDDDEPANTLPDARLAVARLRDQTRDLLARLEAADVQLSVLEQAARAARSQDPELWPDRREAVTEKLATDPLDGAAAWLTAWARAFLSGCPAETERLVTEPFPLPPEAGWCPDRLSTATDALAARSVQRLEPLLRYLAAGAPIADRAAVPDELRAHALIMHARLLLHAGQPGAADLLGQASAAGHHQEAEVLAVRAATARLAAKRAMAEAAAAADQAQAEAAAAADHAQAEAAAQAELAAAYARRAWQADRRAATAVEMFCAERRGTGTPLGSLDNARALVDALPPVADPEGALDVLILPVPDEIWLAAAGRAAREHDYAAARRLAGRISASAGALLAAEAADLRVRIAKQAEEPAGAVAGSLSAAGLSNAIAGQTQHAIDQYTEALQLVSDHQDATLGLADALLVASWGKPLGEVAGQFHRAVELLDTDYARHPLEARTSWSLMTYSYLASVLSNQAAAEARARELWRAPIAAARAIAFDPSQAQRWVRLAEALGELNCDHAAAVLSGHAIRLDPGDQVVWRNRIATLTSLGEAGAALELLGKAARESGDGWFSAVRAIVLKAFDREASGPGEAARLDEARNAANDALRIEPQNLWYHLVRADVLLRAGKADLAEEDFEYLWRESRLDQADGLSFATRAAIELQLGTDAVALSTRALNLADATVGDYGDRFNRGAALVLDGDEEGLHYLDDAMGLAATPFAIDYLRGRLGHLTDVCRHSDIAVDPSAAAAALEARAAQVAADDRPLQARIQAELDRAARNEHYSPEVSQLAEFAAGLARAWCGLALGDPQALVLLGDLARKHGEYPELASAARALAAAPLPGLEPAAQETPHASTGAPVPSEPVVQAYLPVSWFAGLAHPMDHEIIQRFVPDARARLRRGTGAILPGVNFRDDAGLEPAGFRVVLHDTEVAAGWLEAARWYCPAHLVAALRPQLRAEVSDAPEAAGPDGFPVLLSFPAPVDPDPLTALVAWSPAEVVTRRMEWAFAAWQAAGSGPGRPESAQSPPPA